MHKSSLLLMTFSAAAMSTAAVAQTASASAASDVLGMAPPVAAALVTATVALLGLIVNAYFTWRNAERQKELVGASALMSYEFEARKRLYTECEPVLFQLNEACAQAFKTCQMLGTKRVCDRLLAERENIASGTGHWMMCRSTETIAATYSFLYPLALFFQLREKMTRVDCSLDPVVSFQYRLARTLFLAFQDDECLAERSPRLSYDPRVAAWRQKRLQNPAKHWWQGVTPGRLDRAVRMLFLPTGEGKRVITYGEFEDLYLRLFERGEGDEQKALGVFANPLYGFTPDKRPVFWRLVLVQAHLHRALARPIPKEIATKRRSKEARIDYLRHHLKLPGSKKFDLGPDNARADSLRHYLKLPEPQKFDLGPDKGWPARAGPADRTLDPALDYLVDCLSL